MQAEGEALDQALAALDRDDAHVIRRVWLMMTGLRMPSADLPPLP